MFHVLDHAAVVFAGELSQTTQYVIDHYGNTLDEAIRSGVRIAYADPQLCLHDVGEAGSGCTVRKFWRPVEEWEID
jgi:hypothetical protein